MQDPAHSSIGPYYRLAAISKSHFLDDSNHGMEGIWYFKVYRKKIRTICIAWSSNVWDDCQNTFFDIYAEKQEVQKTLLTGADVYWTCTSIPTANKHEVSLNLGKDFRGWAGLHKHSTLDASLGIQNNQLHHIIITLNFTAVKSNCLLTEDIFFFEIQANGE